MANISWSEGHWVDSCGDCGSGNGSCFDASRNGDDRCDVNKNGSVDGGRRRNDVAG